MTVNALERAAALSPRSDPIPDAVRPGAVGLRTAHSLRLARVRKTYGSVVAVDDVSLAVPSGEFLTLLGPSGSGKTTLLMMIAGFVAPSAGDIFVDERRITDRAPERRNFGMVFQGYALFPHMTVAENVAYPLKVRGFARAEVAIKVAQALALVRLGGFEARYPRQLSGGQQQRVAIARALVFSPDVLLLDEPLGALDRQLRAEVQIELKTLHAELGATFVYVTHDQDEALSMSDRVAILNHGRLVQVGAPAELYEHPRTRFAAEFLGKSNCFEAEVTERVGGLARLRAGGLVLLHLGEAAPGCCVLLSLRPEKITLSFDEPVAVPNRLPARVLASAYLGAQLQVVLATEALGRLTASCLAWRTGLDLSPGATVWASWPAEATVLLVE
jgi:putative spermidine/putrescine transport system ATP-binding protein